MLVRLRKNDDVVPTTHNHMTTEQCACERGYGGDYGGDCAELVWPNGCSGHGRCLCYGSPGRICKCDDGWGGEACAEKTSTKSYAAGARAAGARAAGERERARSKRGWRPRRAEPRAEQHAWFTSGFTSERLQTHEISCC